MIRELRKDLDLIGYPKLVRLNPNIPWKTRGNGAICLQVGKGTSQESVIGAIHGEPCYSFQELLEVDEGVDKCQLLERATKVIEHNAELSAKNTNPGIVVLDAQVSLPDNLYWQTVREVMKLDHIKNILENSNAVFKGFKNSRGLIGAAAAISWAQFISVTPKVDKTYEILSYRKKARWGTPREIDEASVIEMDTRVGNTFDNYDHHNSHINIAPNSPCPVLFGIRGEAPEVLHGALKLINSEVVDQWLIFETNQGTDDHLQSSSISEVRPYQSVITEGNIVTEPRTINGGHVIVAIADAENDTNGKIDCAAYEPTKGFREIVKQLKPGDQVRIYGSIRAEPLTINIEKLEIINLADQTVKTANPKCPDCGKSMKSIGSGKGYRCRNCAIKLPETSAIWDKVDRELKRGIYEVPVCARRHLSKPLKRINSN